MRACKDLPVLTLALPDMVSPDIIEVFTRAAERLTVLSRNIAKPNAVFKERCDAFLRIALRGDAVAPQVQSLRDVRVVVHLWATSERFTALQPPTPAFFYAFNNVVEITSSMSLLAMVSLYFDKYDLLGKGLPHLREYLRGQFLKQRRSMPLTLKRFSIAAQTLLDENAPEQLCQKAITAKIPLDAAISDMGIPRGDKNRFSAICQNIYYIHTLEQLNVGDSTSVFSELKRPTVNGMPYENGLLGHKVLSVLIDKCMAKDVALPELWRDVILHIAEDPRVPVGSPNHRRWWNTVGEKRASWVARWLSQLDLGVFFKLLKDYAESSGKEDLQRMFPARQKFLQGLYDLGLIRGSRLFLGAQAVAFLKRTLDKKALPHYAHLNISDKAVIYLDLGKVHMVEGSHSFPLLLFDRLPPESSILSYNKNFFTIDELNKELRVNHTRLILQGITRQEHSCIRHYPTTWHKEALGALKLYGLNIPPSSVLDADTYKQYRSKYSIR